MGLAATGLLFSAVSTGVGMYSQMQQGKAASAVADYNAQLLAAEGKNKEAEFMQGVSRERTNQDRHLSAIHARLSTSGVQSDTGTALQIFGDTASAFQTSISDAARSTNMQLAANRQKQAMLRYEGATQKQASLFSAAGTGLQGFGQAASMYDTHKYNGTLP
jgi:hypothetical protein